MSSVAQQLLLDAQEAEDYARGYFDALVLQVQALMGEARPDGTFPFAKAGEQSLTCLRELLERAQSLRLQANAQVMAEAQVERASVAAFGGWIH